MAPDIRDSDMIWTSLRHFQPIQPCMTVTRGYLLMFSVYNNVTGRQYCEKIITFPEVKVVMKATFQEVTEIRNDGLHSGPVIVLGLMSLRGVNGERVSFSFHPHPGLFSTPFFSLSLFLLLSQFQMAQWY